MRLLLIMGLCWGVLLCKAARPSYFYLESDPIQGVRGSSLAGPKLEVVFPITEQLAFFFELATRPITFERPHRIRGLGWQYPYSHSSSLVVYSYYEPRLQELVVVFGGPSLSEQQREFGPIFACDYMPGPEKSELYYKAWLLYLEARREYPQAAKIYLTGYGIGGAMAIFDRSKIAAVSTLRSSPWQPWWVIRPAIPR